MAVKQSTYDPKTLITIDDSVLEAIPLRYGIIAESGLFNKTGIVTDSFGFNYKEQTQSAMTGTKSRLSREADRVDEGKDKKAWLSGVSFKLEGAVQYEDIANRVKDWDSLGVEAKAMTVADVMAEKLPPIYNTMKQMNEYSLLTAAQGNMLDPYDDSSAIDMFDALNQTRVALTIDLTDTADVLGQIQALANQITEAQTYGSGYDSIEVKMGEAAFTKLVRHPDIIALYEAAYTGRGDEYLNNPILNGRVNDINKSVFGNIRSIVLEGITFSTYPRKFTRWDRTMITPVADNKGFTIVRGVSGLYQTKFVPAPYLSTLGKQGQELYAWQTPIKDDTHFEFYLESHPIHFMAQPTLSFDITFTLA